MKNIKNKYNGYHLNSKYWQNWKNNLPEFNYKQKQIIIGIILSDATIYRKSKHAIIKFEQGKNQKDFIEDIFYQCQPFSFIKSFGIRYEKNTNIIKSYWFRTFSHENFTELWNIFYENNKKVIKKDIIYQKVDDIALAYLVMGDGSIHREKRVLTLHTQGFSFSENKIISYELNKKFGFNTKVKSHKNTSYVIQFSAKDGNKLHNIINSHVIPSMQYKVPRIILLLKI